MGAFLLPEFPIFLIVSPLVTCYNEYIDRGKGPLQNLKEFKMSKKFNDFRFDGLNRKSWSNKYMTMDRVSESEEKIVVKVADSHLFQTRYGYGLILDANHVVWLKDWAVSINWYGNEVLLDKNFFNVKESTREFEDFDEEPEHCNWEHWLDVAKIQRDADNRVIWAK